MQAEASALPVVQLNAHKAYNSCKKPQSNSKNSTLEPKKLSPYRSTLLPSNKKCLNPLLGGPYKSSIKQQSLLSGESRSANESILRQRVMSAKMLRFKQLQNQLADAHYHLNELANENRLLKALQKRQDSALRRYEGTNAELPRIINSHHEELRVLQTKYKKLKELHKDTCDLLKEKENELHSVSSQNKHLLQLSKDRNLGEREKLQLQISDMNHRTQQQQETIQLLHRKLALETKSLKQQLHTEIIKHKETHRNLQETIEKLRSLESLLDNREKRLYYNGQLPAYDKKKNLSSHSLTNLRDISTSNSVKAFQRTRRSENDVPKNNKPPSLDTLESNDERVTRDRSADQLKSETMTNLQQLRKFRLQKSPDARKNARSMDDLRLRFKDMEERMHDDEKITYQNALVGLKAGGDNLRAISDESGKLRKLFSRIKDQNSRKLYREVRTELDYSSNDDNDDDEEGNVNRRHVERYLADTAQKSRELYARLISSTDDTSDSVNHYSEGEELDTRLAKDLKSHKYKNKSKISQHYKDRNPYDSGTEIDSEERADAHGDYFSAKRNSRVNLSRYEREQYGKFSSNYTRPECNTLHIKERSVIGNSKNVESQMMSDNAPNGVRTEDIIPEQSIEDTEKTWLEGQRLSSESNRASDCLADVLGNENRAREEEIMYLRDKPVSFDTSYDNFCDTFDRNNANEKMMNLSDSEREAIQDSSQQVRNEDSEIISKTELVDSEEAKYEVAKEDSKAILDREKLEVSRIDTNDQLVRNSTGEHSTTHHIDEEVLNKDDSNVEIRNELNASDVRNISALSTSTHAPRRIEQNNGVRAETADAKRSNDKKKVINYNKEKLLATMKAIDDNENIEFFNQGLKSQAASRMQITENLYRGLPTHSKPKRDVIRDIFEDNHIENKTRGACSKSH